MKKILVTGDVYLGTPSVEKLAERGAVNTLFGDFSPIIHKSNLSITNLESPITERGNQIAKTGPYLKASPKSLNVLKKAGFNLLTLANNHILDYGKPGLESTLKECRKLNLDYVGVGNSLEAAREPFVTDLGDGEIAVINIAENEFSTIGTNAYGANPLDLINNSYDIKKAKAAYTKVIVIIHGGREHYNLPSPHFRKTLRFFANCGADAVIAHHTHCVSGYEIYKNTPIFYGLGNFLFDQLKNRNRPLWNTGLAVRLFIDPNENCTFELLPYRQCDTQDPFIVLMQGKEKVEFLEGLEQLNTIISDDLSLKEHWRTYIVSQKGWYQNKLMISNKWLRKLEQRNIVPLSLFTNEEHKLHTINLIKAETHREILLDILESEEK